MKPFCLGYISQVMWRLFVTFPRNGAGTCIPHPGPGLPADSTGHSLQLSNFPSTAQWRSCLCCQSRPGKVLLSKTNWRSQFRKFFFLFGGLSLILVFWLSGRATICLPAFLPLRIAGVRHVRLVAGWSCNLVPV